MSLTQAMLREYVTYAPETGVFTWNVSRGSIMAGSVLGSRGGRKHLYHRVTINGEVHLAHRLAWLYMTGSLPSGLIDHINGNPRDNRWENLRCGSPLQNAQNLQRAHRDSTSGKIGAYPNKRNGTWYAQICKDRKISHIGTYQTADEAHAAYIQAKRQIHEFCSL